MAKVDVKNKRIFCRHSHQYMFCKKSLWNIRQRLQKNMCTGAFFEKNSGCRPATLFKKRLMDRGFFSQKFLKLFGTALYSTAVHCFLWFDWILGNFDLHLRFTQKPENFDHHSWFYRKDLKFWRSYKKIWKPYLEQNFA